MASESWLPDTTAETENCGPFKSVHVANAALNARNQMNVAHFSEGDGGMRLGMYISPGSDTRFRQFGNPLLWPCPESESCGLEMKAKVYPPHCGVLASVTGAPGLCLFYVWSS